MSTKPTIKFTESGLTEMLAQYSGYVGRVNMPADDKTGIEIRPFTQYFVEFRLTYEGIAFVVDGDSYTAQKDMEYMLHKACQNDLNISALDFNKIIKTNKESLHSGFEALKESLLSRYYVQLAMIRYEFIKSVELNEDGFKINGVEFRLCNDIISPKRKVEKH